MLNLPQSRGTTASQLATMHIEAEGNPTTTRSTILQTADSLINGDRQADYGPPHENFQRIADHWNTYLSHRGIKGANHIDAADVATMMTLLKIARAIESPKADTYIDAAGYIALAGELAGVKP
jgi:hypothetical protein